MIDPSNSSCFWAHVRISGVRIAGDRRSAVGGRRSAIIATDEPAATREGLLFFLSAYGPVVEGATLMIDKLLSSQEEIGLLFFYVLVLGCSSFMFRTLDFSFLRKECRRWCYEMLSLHPVSSCVIALNIIESDSGTVSEPSVISSYGTPECSFSTAKLPLRFASWSLLLSSFEAFVGAVR